MRQKKHITKQLFRYQSKFVKHSLMELLKDPTNSRMVKSLPPPAQRPLTTEQIFRDGRIDWRLMRQFLRKQGKIKKNDLLLMVKTAANTFRNQPNLVCIEDPITIVGDIHGQFYDFDRLLENDIGGNPKQNKYLFLGDYVDRGSFSIQCLVLLLSIKLCYPKTIVMLRGNHECRQLTAYHSFREQCLLKYDQQTYQIIMDLFDTLPLACLINGKFLCVHGGISPDLRNLHDIEKIDRFHQIPKGGLFCDLLWADPIKNPNGNLGALAIPNSQRGCSYYFGTELIHTFLGNNGLISVIRAHQAVNEGFTMFKWSGEDKFPTVITIFSAPNYCDYYKNRGAVIRFKNNNINFQQFNQSPHPYILPKFLDLFSWSVPFISERVTQMFFHLIKPHLQYLSTDMPFDIKGKADILQKLLLEHKKKMEENLQLTRFGGNCPDQRLLQTGKYNPNQGDFEYRKNVDQQNQSRPHFTI